MSWQPIESAPMNQHILITDGKRVVQAYCEGDPEDHDWDIMGYRWPAPFDRLGFTHWMPMPAPPRR